MPIRLQGMHILIAGGTGAIGLPLAHALSDAGHQVTALSRSTARHAGLRESGITGVAVDALDRDALVRVVERARPTHIVHQLTALPEGGPRRNTDIEQTNRLRIEGTRNLLDAAIHAGAKRFIAGSFAVLAEAPGNPAGDAVRSMEAQVLDATRRGAIDGVVLRYGLFYGLEAGSTRAMLDMVKGRRLPVPREDHGVLPMIHVADAVSATQQALQHGTPGAVYNVVDNQPVSMTRLIEVMADAVGAPRPFRIPVWLMRLLAPVPARMSRIQLRLSNADTRSALRWSPRYPTIDDGMRALSPVPSGTLAIQE